MSEAELKLECRQAVYVEEKYRGSKPYKDDLVVIKEYQHHPDGTITPNLRLIENFKRPYWITKQAYRQHKQKKTCESLTRLEKRESTQAGLIHNAKKALGMWGQIRNLKHLGENPYLYGTDITTPALIKRMYMDKYPGVASNASIAILDIETNIDDFFWELDSPSDLRNIRGLKEIHLGHQAKIKTKRKPDAKNNPAPEYYTLMSLENGGEWRKAEGVVRLQGDNAENTSSTEIDLISLTFKDKAVLAVTKNWLLRAGCPVTGKEGKRYTPAEFLEEVVDYVPDRLKKHIKDRNCVIEYFVEDNPLEAIKRVISYAHKWKPDIISGWNLHYDICGMLDDINRYGGDAGDIFSDPIIPEKYRVCRYEQGPKMKIKEDGSKEPKDFYDQWHTLRCPASFYFIDQAAVFRFVRFARGKEPGGMSLDNVLSNHTNIKKLKDKHNLEHLPSGEWHKWVTKFDKLEYSAYNIGDCVSCEILDENPKVKDLTLTLGVACQHSEYKIYTSMPKRSVEAMYYTCLSEGTVLAASSGKMRTDELDDLTVGTDGWIVTLPAHNILPTGLKCLEGLSDWVTRFWAGVYDVDVKSAYPIGQIIANCSRETTVAEIIGIEGLTEEEKRAVGMNMTAGTINAMEISCMVYDMPTFGEFREEFEKDHENDLDDYYNAKVKEAA